MKPFSWDAAVPPSKSLWNRWQIIASFANNLPISPVSQAEDVVHLQRALQKFKNGERTLFCGSGGTTLRFLALRVSRESGVFRLQMTPRLAERPQTSVLDLLQQLGVSARLNNSELEVESRGWTWKGSLSPTDTTSSQGLSALLLSSWNLPVPLRISKPRELPSRGYLEMTIHVLQDAGMQILETPDAWEIAPEQSPRAAPITVEPDMSSAFSVAAAGAVGGGARIRNFPTSSYQPDFVFVEIMTKMGFVVGREGSDLVISPSRPARGVDACLQNSPDLLPVLSVLCCLTSEPSRLRNLGHAEWKESNRVLGAMKMAEALGGRARYERGDLFLQGPGQLPVWAPRVWPSDHDHRVAMAVLVASQAGVPWRIDDPTVVRKSFSELEPWL